jgi:cytochrome b
VRENFSLLLKDRLRSGDTILVNGTANDKGELGAAADATRRVLVWDLPTRSFHWLLVAAMAAAWWTAENRHMDWHRWSGYTILWLILMRLYWGFVGSSTARFANFVRGPWEIAAYLKGLRGADLRPYIGHNPLGALSVVALILVVFLQIGFGLFSVDVDGLESGPLALFVSFDAGRLASKLHHINFNILLGLVALHIVAVILYVAVGRKQLLRPMITGRRSDPKGDSHEATLAPTWRLIIGMPISALIVWAISIGFQF